MAQPKAKKTLTGPIMAGPILATGTFWAFPNTFKNNFIFNIRLGFR